MMKFIHLLQKPTSQRTKEDIDALFRWLCPHKAFLSLSEADLRSICRNIRYEKHPANALLFRRHELIRSWYILLSGSVFIDERMYIADDSFGKRRIGGGGIGGGRGGGGDPSPSDSIVVVGEFYRTSECIVSEPSEMIVIDYLGVSSLELDQLDEDCVDGMDDDDEDEEDEEGEVEVSGYSGTVVPLPVLYSQNRHLRYSDSSLFDQNFLDCEATQRGTLRQSDRSMDRCYVGGGGGGSRASDTSSLCSGSDMMMSSTEDQPIDLTGLIESIVDSDDDDDFQRNGEREEEDEEELRSMHDAFRETLEKLPAERTDRDIGLILENIQHLPAFNNMTLATRQALCGVMRYAAIDAKDTVVMTDGEQLDSWSVILNGEVETIHPSGAVKVLKQGESFGFTAPTAEKVYHEGLMHTKVNNCQFICISQDDYCRIMQQGAENIESVKENNQVVLVTEERVFDDRKARVVIRGTPEKLLDQLMLRLSSVDPTYTDDFLLTYRTFFKSPLPVAQKLLKWLNNSSYRDQVVTIVLDWVNSHYSDFEMEPRMMDLLEQLERNLEELNLNQQLKMLRMTCAFKAKPRTVILNRTEKKEVLHFNVLGGLERGCGIYVSQVEKGSKADEIGLKRGDQILEVNNQNFERISHNRALEILRGSTHLSITVKSNLLGFKEMVSTPSVSGSRKESKGHPRKQPLGQIMSADAKFGSAKNRQRPPVIRGNKEDERASFLSGGNKSKLRQALMKLNILPRSSIMNNSGGGGGLSVSQAASRKGSTSGGSSPLIRTRFSSSHPDLSTLKLCPADDVVSSFPDHVLKIFQDDQSFKFLLVFKETTAREVVMLALQEFGITTPASSKYSLCEVTVLEEGFVKQRRLPDQLSNLADRCALNSRYYLKWNDRTDPLIPDDIIGDVLRECQTHFLLLDCAETAAQLTIKDFQIFRDIHPTEYVIDLFRSPSNYGTPNLTKFSQLSNSEMFWVATQICSETNLNRRTKTMKHFIQIAKHCQECKNFNSLFAIISGLGHGSVQRLKQTWDKLPSKYLRLFEDLQKLMDPSRNMSRYRNLINSETSHPPLIPFFPLVKKDLTFIHLGNDSLVDGLINFEKLRMIAKEVRHICSMAPAYSDVNISINASAAALMRKKLSGTMQTNPRKIYEETQMVRRVRAYLTTYKTIEDEAVLADMSNQCEPSVAFGFLARKQEAGGCTNNHPVTLTKQTTAAISLGPKFGADSPDAVHKLLQLTDRVRPLDNRKQQQQQQQRHQHHVLSTVTLSGGSSGGQQTVKPGCLSANNQAMTLTTTHSTSSSNSSSSSVLLLSPESSSVLGPNQTTGPERRPTIAAKDRMVVGGGSASNSPTSSIGSGAGRRLVLLQQGTNNYRPKRSESDSGHNSSSNCDSNSTSSVGSTGSPSLAKPRPRVSSMRQTSTQSFGRSSATTAAAAAAADGGTLKQQSRSIFYVSSMSDLSQSSKTTAGQSSRAYCAPTVSGQNSSRPKVATKDSEVKERSSVRSRDSEATSLKEEEDEEEEVRRGRRTTTHRRTSSSPLRPPGQVLHQQQQQQQQQQQHPVTTTTTADVCDDDESEDNVISAV